MLRTVPEARFEVQPQCADDNSLALVLDGRIDNREALIASLSLSGNPSRLSDSAIVLAGYERWGPKVVERLLGAFAFAVWDAKARRLFVARDHFGIRPLYYVNKPGSYFAFASEETALLQVGLAEGGINTAKVAEFLLLPVIPDEEATFWNGVQAVPPAHAMEVSHRGDVQRSEYWSLDPERETQYAEDSDYLDRFNELFGEAVRCRLRASTPVGSMLSGGLDSTAVACKAAQELSDDQLPLRTYSAVFESIPEADERRFQEAALKVYGDRMQPCHFAADRASPMRHLTDTTLRMGRPNEGINDYIPAELYHRAGRQGVRVLLDGFDGDTTVSHGKAYYNELLWSGRWTALWHEIKQAAALKGGTQEDARRAFKGWLKHFGRRHPVLKHVVNGWHQVKGSAVDIPNTERLKIASQGGHWDGDSWEKYFRDRYLSQVESRFTSMPEAAEWRKERHHHHMMLTRPLMESALRGFDAKATAAQIEARFPFYDVRLVEYCLSLPGHLKRREGWDRWIERAALDDVLPHEVQWRQGKPNLIRSYVKGLLRNEKKTFHALAERVSSDASPIVHYFEPSAISELAMRMASEKLAGPEDEPERVMLWRAVALERWLSLPTTTSHSV
jgi:asparagine synthase (glutamine-hydrolysing)